MKGFSLLLVCLVGVIYIFSSQMAVAQVTQKTESDAALKGTPFSSESDERSSSIELKIIKKEATVDVMIGDELFTTFDFGSYKKPILYPVYGPGQIGMTRNWPMKDGVKGEQHDHPHHKSIWIGHEINGLHFWSEQGGSVKTVDVSIGQEIENGFVASSKWVRDTDEQTMLSDSTIYQFGFDESARWIDCSVTFLASHGDFTFDDTKEGLFAIRTHPDLRLKANPKAGVGEVFGNATNSEGVKGAAIWGKPAKWLLYHGTIDGKPMSIAMYDHPQNLRHPTTWHARDYGLVTANPFGQHHFMGKAKGAGKVTIKKDKSLSLKYRVEFIGGIATAADVNSRYERFVSQTTEPSKKHNSKSGSN